jgi:hypothetical protein
MRYLCAQYICSNSNAFMDTGKIERDKTHIWYGDIY